MKYLFVCKRLRDFNSNGEDINQCYKLEEMDDELNKHCTILFRSETRQ